MIIKFYFQNLALEKKMILKEKLILEKKVKILMYLLLGMHDEISLHHTAIVISLTIVVY